MNEFFSMKFQEGFTSSAILFLVVAGIALIIVTILTVTKKVSLNLPSFSINIPWSTINLDISGLYLRSSAKLGKLIKSIPWNDIGGLILCLCILALPFWILSISQVDAGFVTGTIIFGVFLGAVFSILLIYKTRPKGLLRLIGSFVFSIAAGGWVVPSCFALLIAMASS